MSVNSYICGLADMAIIRDQERLSIQRSITALKARLNSYFEDEIKDSIIFGSYSRGTILPRLMDANSDIDYMIVFADSSIRPQTHLDRLRRFVELHYSRSEIYQSHPTIVLSLNHIRFELVPAIHGWLTGINIPAKASDYEDWISTDPNAFNEELITANQSHGNKIKPLIRLMKYWNGINNYPFESYSLEQDIIEHGFGFFGLFGGRQLKDYFFKYIEEGLDLHIFAPKWKKDAVSRAKQLAINAYWQESDGYAEAAERTIYRLLPPI
ncbi:MAG: nucleotidyltransferase domain-containing protein [Candidatus Thiodiazotropha sp. (ex Myrtea sp. 'scaly one' KF741663)]|nr:nucleotidyltransferase domain-containing protein [Candidatus Thiodiazotropha sp. (ex Myrtea sp. 'scaly one' KF741663)]